MAGGPIARVLSLRPLVWMGTVSYGAYLWHYPVVIELDSARTGLGGLGLLAVRVAATFALAAVSYYLIERPVMEGVFWRSLRAAGPAAAPPRGHRGRGGGRHRSPGECHRRAPGAGLAGGPGHRGRVAGRPPAPASPGAGDRAPGADRGRLAGVDRGRRDGPLRRGLRDRPRGPVRHRVRRATALPLDDHGAVGDPFGNCPMWPTWWADDVRQLHPQVVGLVIGFWEVQDRWLTGRWQHIGDPAYDAYETAQLERAVTILSSRRGQGGAVHLALLRQGSSPTARPGPRTARPGSTGSTRLIEAGGAPPCRGRSRSSRSTLPQTLHGQFTLDPRRPRWSRQGDGVHTTTLAGGTYLAPKVLPLSGRHRARA